MAIKLGTNDLILYRRHTVHCTRFPGKEKPRTYEPTKPKDKTADTCSCPIQALGYLMYETEWKDGKERPRRVPVSLAATTWENAHIQRAKLYERGRVSDQDAMPKTSTDMTVEDAGKQWLASKTGAALKPVEDSTLSNYENHIHNRILPYCKANDIKYIKTFEEKNACRLFTLSWRNMQKKEETLLGQGTRIIEFKRFKMFLDFCVSEKWIKESGADKVEVGEAEDTARYGLELEEYQQMVNAPPAPKLSAKEQQETVAARELMRWSGLRISDCAKFNESEIVRNENDNGWNAKFYQKKTKRHKKSRGLCITPIPDHVVELLRALPGRMMKGVKHFFTCSEIVLANRICLMAERAQLNKPFAHKFSVHCLRHTMAIQHLNNGVDLKYVSKWLGHQSLAITADYYSNWITSTIREAEIVNQASVAKMMNKIAQLSA